MGLLVGSPARRALAASDRARGLWGIMTVSPLREEIEKMFSITLVGDPGSVCGLAASASHSCTNLHDVVNFVRTSLLLDTNEIGGQRLVSIIEEKRGTAASYAWLVAILWIALDVVTEVAVFDGELLAGFETCWVEAEYLADGGDGQPKRTDAYDLFVAQIEIEEGDDVLRRPNHAPIVLSLAS